MEYTLPLQSITDVWANELQHNEAIKDYCQKHYGKKQIVFTGSNPRESPDGEYCPMIIIMNGSKIEGDDQSVLSYTTGIAWVIKNEKISVNGGDPVPNGRYTEAERIDYIGAKELDEMGQLIYEAVQTIAQERGWPISRIDYDITPLSTFPQFSGTLVCITEREPALGETLTY